MLPFTNSKPISMWWYVYILQCSDGKTYTGCTSTLRKRISRHKEGEVLSTKKRLPVKLAVVIAFPDKYNAFTFEKYLKSGSGRAFANRHFLKTIKDSSTDRN